MNNYEQLCVFGGLFRFIVLFTIVVFSDATGGDDAFNNVMIAIAKWAGAHDLMAGINDEGGTSDVPASALSRKPAVPSRR